MDFYSPQVIWNFLSGKACATNGLSDQTELSSMSILPNPTTNQLFIHKSGTWHFEIIDQFGKVLLSGDEQTEISLEALTTGIYWIKVFDEEGSVVQRIVKINE
jgi:hypothetical protein